jgi:hypothetical protein
LDGLSIDGNVPSPQIALFDLTACAQNCMIDFTVHALICLIDFIARSKGEWHLIGKLTDSAYSVQMV